MMSVLFAGAYGQYPLYSSNQRTYFLSAIAFAERGALAGDWLANATNHIPAFSLYAFAVIRWLSPTVFYFVHAGLVALYLYCLIRIAERTLGCALPRLIAAIVLLTAMHSEFVATGLAASGLPPIEFLEEFFRETTEGLASMPLLRHFHQPSAFGVLLLASIAAYLDGRRTTAAIIVGLVPWFHAAYFLPASLVTVACMTIELREGRGRSALRFGLTALVVVLPVLLYMWSQFTPGLNEVSRQANEILVHERFPHHAHPPTWFGASAVLQLLWVGGGLFIAHAERRLFTILGTMFAVGATLTLAQVATGSDALAMLQPWRLFVFLVPISTALIVAAAFNALPSRLSGSHWQEGNTVRTGVALMSLLCVAGITHTALRIDQREPSRPALRSFVTNHCEPGDNYVVPPRWGWFRISMRCPTFVDEKNHPYRDTEVIEWYQRLQLAEAFYAAEDAAAALAGIREHAEITHVVVEAGPRHLHLGQVSSLRLVFEDDEYVVYKLEDDAMLR